MFNIVVMVTCIRYVYHTRCVHYGDYDKCALVAKIWSYYFPSVSQIKTQISNLVLVFCVVLLCALTFRVLHCDAGYDFRIKTMFVLFALFVFVYGQWCPTHIVLCFCFVLYFVLCTLCCQFVFLGCPFLIVLSVFNFLFTFIIHEIFITINLISFSKASLNNQQCSFNIRILFIMPCRCNLN